MSKFPFEESFTEPVEMIPEEREESIKSIVEALSKQLNIIDKELTEEEKALNREVWGEDNITLV